MGLKIAKDYVPYEGNIEKPKIKKKPKKQTTPEIYKTDKTMRYASVNAGKCVSYFAQMKYNCPKRFEYINKLGDGNLLIGYQKLDKELNTIPVKFYHAMTLLGKKHAQAEFARYANFNRNTLGTIIRTSKKGKVRSIDTLDKMKMLLEKYEEFIK